MTETGRPPQSTDRNSGNKRESFSGSEENIGSPVSATKPDMGTPTRTRSLTINFLAPGVAAAMTR